MTADTGISGSQYTCMLPLIKLFVGPPTNPNGGIFTTEIGLSVSILSLVNITTGGWSSPFFHHLWVWLQGHFCWWLFRIILYQILCGLVVLWHNVTQLNHPFRTVSYYKLILQQLGLPHMYHMGYIGLWFKDFQSTAIRKYIELFPPQIISKITSIPPYWSCFYHKVVSWLFQTRKRWYRDESKLAQEQSLQGIIKSSF